MKTPKASRIAQRYFDCLVARQPERIPYAPHVELWTPLGPAGLAKPIAGAAAAHAFFGGIAGLIERVEILNVFDDGEWCAFRAHIGLTAPRGAVLHVMDVFRVERDLIAFQENHFDPRPAAAS